MMIFGYVQGSLVLGLLIIFTATGWAQTAPDGALSSCATLYRRAAPLLEMAQQKLDARQLAEAKSLVTEANSLFSLLQKECASLLTDRALTFKEEQQIDGRVRNIQIDPAETRIGIEFENLQPHLADTIGNYLYSFDNFS